MNLLRNPIIDDSQSYENEYLSQLYQSISATMLKNNLSVSDRIYVIYLHLVFAQVENLNDFTSLGEKRNLIKPRARIID